MPHGRGAVACPGARVRQVRDLAVEEVVAVPGSRALPATHAVEALVACCLDLPLLEAVVVCDSALRAGDASVAQLARAASGLPAGCGAVIETDGSRYHPDPARDQVVDNALYELGRRVLRYGWASVVQDGAAVVLQVQVSLAAGRTPSTSIGAARRAA